MHVIPEFIVFNGSSDVLLVKENGRPEILIEPGKIASLRPASRPLGLDLSFSFIEYGCRSAVIPVGKLGLKVAIVKAQSGSVVGSLCVQTMIDTQGDSRLVVKVGDVKFGSLASGRDTSGTGGIFKNDFVRLRVRWTELVVQLMESKQADIAEKPTGDSTKWTNSSKNSLRLGTTQEPVASVIFSRFFSR